MNICVYNIVESHTDTIIGHLGNSSKADLLLHIVQCWLACAVDEDNRDLTIVLYCSVMMYKYYSIIRFF